MPNFLTHESSRFTVYLKLRLQLASVEDPVQRDEITSQIEDIRAHSIVVSVFGAFWDIQLKHPAILPLIGVSLVLKFFF